MRTTALTTLACLALLFGACGDSNNAFEFRTLSAEPSGEAVKIAYDMKAGEGVRMRMKMTGSMEMTGDMEATIPMNMSMAMVFKCVEVKANGDKVLEMSIEGADLDLGGRLEGREREMPDFTRVGGTVTLGKNGHVSAMDLATGVAEVDAKLSQVLKNPGFQYFVPMPEEGLRVGEALDLAKIMPKEVLAQLMKSAGPNLTVEPDLRGELVLLGTREIDGERAAEFGLNMVMNLQMDREGMTMDMGMRFSGKQHNSLRTGFPIGGADWTMEMRMDSKSGHMEMGIESNMKMQIECEPLR